MKKKTGIMLGALALVFGVGAVGLVGANSAVNARATAGDKISSLQLVGAALGVGWTNTANTDYQFVEQADGSFCWTGAFTVERFRVIQAGTWSLGLNWANVVSTSEKVADGSFDSALTVYGSDNDNNIACKVAGTYTLTVNAEKTTLSITTPTAATYDISEFAVVNNVVEATAFATEKATDGVNFSPTKVVRAGYTLQGWYTDAACTTAYVSKAWTAAGSLYAKYATLADRTVYFQTLSGSEKLYVYTFGGGNECGVWPGKEVTQITDGVNFQSLGGVCKVTFSKDYDDTHFIFNKGGTQSANLLITNGAYYWQTAGTDSTGDADKGSAAAVVYDINAARKAVVASGSTILVSSICGISKATATALVGEYDALNDTAKGYVNAATDYVYNYPDTSSGNDVAFAQIIAQLRLIATKAGSTPAAVLADNTTTTPVIVMVVSIGVAALAAGALWMSRRKER